MLFLVIQGLAPHTCGPLIFSKHLLRLDTPYPRMCNPPNNQSSNFKLSIHLFKRCRLLSTLNIIQKYAESSFECTFFITHCLIKQMKPTSMLATFAFEQILSVHPDLHSVISHWHYLSRKFTANPLSSMNQNFKAEKCS